MKPFFILTVFLFFSLSAFAQVDSLSAENNVLSGKWRLMEFKNLTTGVVTDTASVQNGVIAHYKNIRLKFHDSAGRGDIWGKSFCNDVGGYYKVYPNNKLSVSGLGGTDVDCLYEDKLSNAMRDASSYRKNYDTLFILYNHDSEEMVFNIDK